MEVYFYQDSAGNFGDDLNGWLWPRLIPDLLSRDDGLLLLGIGTLLDDKIPPAPTKVVFGSGAGYGGKPSIDASWRFLCVRGPLTASALGLPPELAVTDAAALVSGMVPAAAKRHAVSFMPHHVSKIRAEVGGLDLRVVCKDAGFHYIDPSGEPSSTLADIQASELILGEAMHACIVADSLRVPWIPIRLYDHILPFKWCDWCRSLELDYNPCVYQGELTSRTAAWGRFLSAAVSTAQPCLSDAAVFTSRLERLLELAKQLRQCSPVHQAKSHGSLQAAVEKQIKAGSASWLRTYYSGVQELSTAVPQNSSVILVDEDQWAAGDTIAGRRRIHFPARNGSYWGPPATGASAVEELAQLRNAGVEYIVFAWPAFWWLDHYEMLSDYLSSHCRQILSTPRIRVFHLGPDSEQ